ncbi:MAG: arginine repressor [Candidatus Nanopelagicaceae bacterium]|jgi:transcriptional regulator of arginine metabolism|nr:arginine repressor [Candidatus Nanopelagicaceae bacterium]
MNSNNANSRKSTVAKLIGSGKIASQSDLVKALKKQGFAVTQGTASRDLEDIGAIRVRNADGEMVYALTDAQPISTKSSFPSELVLTATPSGNLVVIRTPIAAAQMLASAIDGLSQSGKLASAIGTVAGDDTVIVVADTATGGSALAKKILGLANSKSGGK